VTSVSARSSGPDIALRCCWVGTAIALSACNMGSAAQLAEVPAAYHGAYNRTQIGCENVRTAADAELEIRANRLRYAVWTERFDGRIISVSNGERSGITVIARSETARERPEITLQMFDDAESTNLEITRVWRQPGSGETGGMSAPIFMERCNT
jgi:hypothetical protein